MPGERRLLAETLEVPEVESPCALVLLFEYEIQAPKSTADRKKPAAPQTWLTGKLRSSPTGAKAPYVAAVDASGALSLSIPPCTPTIPSRESNRVVSLASQGVARPKSCFNVASASVAFFAAA